MSKQEKWTSLADNTGVQDLLWSDINATVTTPGQFINSQNQVTLRYLTRTGGNKSELDFLAFEIISSESLPPPTAAIQALHRRQLGTVETAGNPRLGSSSKSNMLARLIPP